MNTQEKEPELGEGVTSAEFWVYDGKLGRRWNVDPIRISFNSSYSGFSDNPIYLNDVKGDKPRPNKQNGTLTNSFYFSKYRKTSSGNSEMTYEQNQKFQTEAISAINGGIDGMTYSNNISTVGIVKTEFSTKSLTEEDYDQLTAKDEKKMIKKLKRQGYTIVYENDYDFKDLTKNRSSANLGKDEIYLEMGHTGDAFHEFAHLCGLSDRYNVIQLTSDNVIFAGDPIYQMVQISGLTSDPPAWWTTSMQLAKEDDPEYFENDFVNPMSNGGGNLTLMQMNLIMNGKKEKQYDQYTFFFRASSYASEVSLIKSIGISANKIIANKTIVYGSTDGSILISPFAGYGNPINGSGNFDFKAARNHDGDSFNGVVKINNSGALIQPYEPTR